MEHRGRHGRPHGQKTELFLRAQGRERSISPGRRRTSERKDRPHAPSHPHTQLKKTSGTRGFPGLPTHPGRTLPRVSEGPRLWPNAQLLEESQAERERHAALPASDVTRDRTPSAMKPFKRTLPLSWGRACIPPTSQGPQRWRESGVRVRLPAPAGPSRALRPGPEGESSALRDPHRGSQAWGWAASTPVAMVNHAESPTGGEVTRRALCSPPAVQVITGSSQRGQPFGQHRDRPRSSASPEQGSGLTLMLDPRPPTETPDVTQCGPESHRPPSTASHRENKSVSHGGEDVTGTWGPRSDGGRVPWCSLTGQPCCLPGDAASPTPMPHPHLISETPPVLLGGALSSGGQLALLRAADLNAQLQSTVSGAPSMWPGSRAVSVRSCWALGIGRFGGTAGLCIWAQGGMQAAGGASVCRSSVLRCQHDGPPGTSPCASEGNGAML